MNRHLSLLVFVLLIPFSFIIGQDPGEEDPQRASTSIMSQVVLPASPEAATLGEYGDTPISAYTGSANFNIPIYTFSGVKIGLGISAAYNTGGIKVEDRGSSSLGIGWALNAGGSISRSVRGAPDMEYNYYGKKDSIFNNTLITGNLSLDQYLHFVSLAQGGIEAQPDAYYYSFNGRSGKFYIDPNRRVIQKEDSDLDIDLVFGAESTTLHPFNDIQVLQEIIITDEQGTSYTFDVPEWTVLQYDDVLSLASKNHNNHEYNSTWHLGKIESYDKKESINLSYTTAPSNYTLPINLANYTSVSFKVEYSGDTGCQDKSDPVGTASTASVTTSYTTNRRFLDQITYQVNSADLEKATFHYSDNNCIYSVDTDQQLDRIEIYRGDNAGNHSFSHHFDYECTDGRLFLQQTGKRKPTENDYSSIPPYSFQYHSTALPVPTSLAQDKWGYYNGINNQTLVPRPDHNEIIWTGGADRSSDENFSVARSLTRITYPTGGYTQVAYEGNQSANTQVTSQITCPGLCRTFENCDGSAADCGLPSCVNAISSDYNGLSFTTQYVDNGYFIIHSEIICGGGTQQLQQRFNGAQSGLASQGTGEIIIRNSSGQIKYRHSFSQTDVVFRDTVKLSNVAAGQTYDLTITGINTRIVADLKVKTFSNTNMTTDIGGVRISTITDHDSDGTFLKGKLYSYTLPNSTLSSGKVISEPDFISEGSYHYDAPTNFGTDPCQNYVYRTITASAGPSFPLGSVDGSFYGYSRVEEHDMLSANGNILEGKTVYYYHNDKKVKGVNDPIKNGKLKMKEVIDSSGMLLKTYNMKYAFDEGQTARQQSFLGYHISALAAQDNKTRLCISNSNPQDVQWSENFLQGYDCSNGFGTKWKRETGDFHTLVNYSVFMTENVESYHYYDENDELITTVSTMTDYDYSNQNVLQPQSVSMVNSDGDIYSTDFYYKDTYPNASIQDELDTLNLVLPAWQSKQYVNDVHFNGDSTVWSFYNSLTGDRTTGSIGTIYPYQAYAYEKSWDENDVLYGKGWDLQETANQYSFIIGRPTKVQRNHWPEIDEYKYATNGKISEYTYKDYTQTWTYNPSSNLLETFENVDLTSSTYTYDEFLRLSTAKDIQREVETTYIYQYKDASNDHNFVESSTYYPSIDTQAQTLRTRNFQDGIGRPIQTLKIGQAPDPGKNIIINTEYDQAGRLSRQYEPFSDSGGDAYSASTTSEYTLTTYEPSPLDRTATVTPPSWHTTSYVYSANTSPLKGYTTGQLNSVIVIDPNQNRVETFTDKRGREILMRKTDSGGNNPNDTETRYNPKDQKTVVLPPDATLTTPDLLYKYLYYPSGQLRSRDLPDAEPIEYVYNNRNLMGYIRDGERKKATQWLARKYDDYGKMTVEGFYNVPTDLAATNEGFSEAQTSSSLVFNQYGTSGITIDKVTNTVAKILIDGSLVIKTYDYDIAGRRDTVEHSYGIEFGSAKQKSVYTFDSQDNMTIEQNTIAIQGYDNHIHSTFKKHEYDHIGRKIGESASDVASGPYQPLSSWTYTAKDQVNIHTLDPLNNLSICEYDYLPNRFMSTMKDMNTTPIFEMELRYGNPFTGGTARLNGDITSQSWKGLGQSDGYYNYEYDYLNRLTDAEYNGLPLGTYSSSYIYNSRGVVTDITRQGSTSPNAQGASLPMDAITKSIKPGTNQVSSVRENGDASEGFKAPKGYAKSTMNLTYDDNGFISTDDTKSITYTRNHLNLPDLITKNGSTDQIEYCYDAEGVLHRKIIIEGSDTIVRDYFGDSEFVNDTLELIHFTDGYLKPKFTGPYVNGILSRSGTQSTYEHSRALEIHSVQDITIDADVTHRAKQCIELNEDFEVNGVYTAIIDPSADLAAPFKAYYTIKDHLGNTRVVFHDENEDGTISQPEILQISNYYPFGAEHGNSITGEFAYRFNGKEKELGLDLEIMRYGARNYDLDLIQFDGVDPLADQMPEFTPYHMSFNNPLRYVDPDGHYPYPHQEVKARVESIAKNITDGVASAKQAISNGFNRLKSSVSNFFRSGSSEETYVNTSSGVSVFSNDPNDAGKMPASDGAGADVIIETDDMAFPGGAKPSGHLASKTGGMINRIDKASKGLDKIGEATRRNQPDEPMTNTSSNVGEASLTSSMSTSTEQLRIRDSLVNNDDINGNRPFGKDTVRGIEIDKQKRNNGSATTYTIIEN